MRREHLINDILDSYSDIFNDFVYENSENLDSYLDDLQTNVYKLKKITNKNDNKYYYRGLIMIHDSLDRIDKNNFTDITLGVIEKIVLFYIQDIEMSKEKMFKLEDILIEQYGFKPYEIPIQACVYDEWDIANLKEIIRKKCYNMYNLFAYFDNQIADVIEYLDRYSLFPKESEYLTKVKLNMTKLFEHLNKIREYDKHTIFQINRIMKSAHDYLEVINNSNDKEEVKYEEKFRTIIDIASELETHINL